LIDRNGDKASPASASIDCNASFAIITLHVYDPLILF
jgi:hypothetical protein